MSLTLNTNKILLTILQFPVKINATF